MIDARSEQERGRVILDFAPVVNTGGEAAVALDCIRWVAFHAPGAQGVVSCALEVLNPQ